MPSPFPGMNPYLEQPGVWPDFHVTLLTELRRALVAQVSEKYVVGVEEELFIHEATAEERRLTARADVAVTERGAHRGQAAPSTGAPAAPTYATLPVTVDVERHRSLAVRDREGGQVVTAIEVLSPTNKDPSKHRDQYEAKRLRLIESGVNLVEIDLLRGWGRMPMDGLPPCDYCVMVSRSEEWPRAGVWPLGLRDVLPKVPTPLRPPDPDAWLDLQAALHRVYDDAGYARRLYRHEPNPPLAADEQAWARQLLGQSES